jgi:predicted transcriptional regulator
MTDLSKLSRRERQIMDSLYAREAATINEVLEDLPNPPTDKAVRRLLEIMEEKGHVKRRKQGRSYVYRPTQSKRRAGEKALRHILDTFFEGALDKAFAIHLGSKDSKITDEQLESLLQLIEDAHKKGR